MISQSNDATYGEAIRMIAARLDAANPKSYAADMLRIISIATIAAADALDPNSGLIRDLTVCRVEG